MGDSGACRTQSGLAISTDWTDEQAEVATACSMGIRATVENCGSYTVLTLGDIDTSVDLYYLRSTGTLVTIDENSLAANYPVCLAGLSAYPVVCSMNEASTSLCQKDGSGD